MREAGGAQKDGAVRLSDACPTDFFGFAFAEMRRR